MKVNGRKLKVKGTIQAMQISETVMRFVDEKCVYLNGFVIAIYRSKVNMHKFITDAQRKAHWEEANKTKRQNLFGMQKKLLGKKLKVTPRSAKESEKRNQLVFCLISGFLEMISEMIKILPAKPKQVRSQPSTVNQRGSFIMLPEAETLKNNNITRVNTEFRFKITRDNLGNTNEHVKGQPSKNRDVLLDTCSLFRFGEFLPGKEIRLTVIYDHPC